MTTAVESGHGVATAGHGAMLEPAAYGIQTKKFVMWLFITADAATFGAILFGYGYLRYGSPNWSTPFAFSPTIINGLVMTVILLTSSLTMLFAVSSARAGERSTTIGWLGATIALGLLFAGLHLHEWFNMFHEGWSVSANPLGGSTLFGATFFSITGLHLLHVVSGVVAIGVIALMYQRGRLDASYIETTGLYWHFVDLVWMFVFPLVYLLNAH
ncbi:MAG TPA: cytochrome c oxidase subunit 3 [Gemmatimonadaceae bacterium]|nr:cytochrome c oxidase subunit 3 [Gemmatimonadaceae bacterium]